MAPGEGSFGSPSIPGINIELLTEDSVCSERERGFVSFRIVKDSKSPRGD